jgi:hypothetical protein
MSRGAAIAAKCKHCIYDGEAPNTFARQDRDIERLSHELISKNTSSIPQGVG